MQKWRVIPYFVTVLFSLATAQTPMPSAQRSEAKRDTAVVKLDESWEPMSEEGLISDFTVEQSTGLTPLELDKLLTGVDGRSQAEAALQPGFRIQLVATRDEQEARQARMDALLNFSRRVYLIYDNPYYKLRLGDCLSRADADSLQQLAIEKGFVSAWVVRTMVNSNRDRQSDPALVPADTMKLQQ